MAAGEKKKFSVWARKISDSNENAFSELFHEVYPKLVKYAWKYTQQEAAAHDITQEAFIKLWKVRKGLDPDQSLLSYLYKMVRNRSLNYLRDERDLNISLDEVSPEAFYTQEDLTAAKAEESNAGAKVLALIDSLPERQREAIRLSRFEGLDHREIAYVMQISPRTVNNHIVTALNTLKHAASVTLKKKRDVL